MSGLLELAERCEQATGPDRELDLAIGDEVAAPTGYDLPFFTASLDAAMTLVPEGWEDVRWQQSRDNDGAIRCWADILLVKKLTEFRGEAATPALALCAAALRARAAQ